MGTSNLASLLHRDGVLSLQLIREIERDSGNLSTAFAKMLIAMGVFDESGLVQYIEKRTEFPIVHGSLITPSAAALEAIDLPLMEELEVIPISIDGRRIKVAMADPLDLNILLQLRFFSDLKVAPVVATFATLERSFYKFNPGFKLAHSPMEKVLAPKLRAAYELTRQQPKDTVSPTENTDAEDAAFVHSLLKDPPPLAVGDPAAMTTTEPAIAADGAAAASPTREADPTDLLKDEIAPNLSQDELLNNTPSPQVPSAESVAEDPVPSPDPAVDADLPTTENGAPVLSQDMLDSLDFSTPEPASSEIQATDEIATDSPTSESEPLVDPTTAETELPTPPSPPVHFSASPLVGVLNHAMAMGTLAASREAIRPIIEEALVRAGFSKGALYDAVSTPATLSMAWGENAEMSFGPLASEELNAWAASQPPLSQWHPLSDASSQIDPYAVEGHQAFAASIQVANHSYLIVSSIQTDTVQSKALSELALKLLSLYVKKP